MIADMQAMTHRKSAYTAHLASETWGEIRRHAADRSLGLCELCGAAGRETHHIRYPRNLADDSADNVLRVCSACHRRLHGMTKLIKDRQLTEVLVDTFKGRPVTVWIDERQWVWAPWEAAWMRALVIPRSLEQRFTHLTAQYARAMEREWGEPYCLPDDKGMPWYRWHPVEEALTVWRVKKAGDGNAYRDPALTDDERFLMQNIASIRKWGKDLQERAMAGALIAHTRAPGGMIDNVTALGQALALTAGVVKRHDETLVDHGQRIERIEQSAKADPDEFLDAETALIQLGRSPNILAPGTGLTEAQWIGSWLKRQGRETGPDKGWALPWGARKTVRTYRRRDIEDAVSVMLVKA